MNIRALGCDGAGVFAGLNALEGFKRDNRLMMAFAARNAPWVMLNVPRVDDALEQIAHPLLADFAVG
ncbi:hypothetical protein PRI8871_02474 [Pseudoprimorskyibacter insulae]|uniref:Uncharacterized protein n=1 Tax=Pseudoprimorskyibacter insulae TaxID=1695997 RepID=A0A2R8AXR4_9RHOB|nr:hypothetical protein [Pseudoprimorskyibacter insulae]SPF80664.1 hypothetical protein PRI8871_02474 [Pseudoprimorskyibacter insulae]